jgi:hypothetical protein
VASSVVESRTALGPAAPVSAILDPRRVLQSPVVVAEAVLAVPVVGSRLVDDPPFLLDRMFHPPLVMVQPTLGLAVAVRAVAAIGMAAAMPAGAARFLAAALAAAAVAAAMAGGLRRLAVSAAATAMAVFLGKQRRRQAEGRHAGEKHQLTHWESLLGWG